MQQVIAQCIGIVASAFIIYSFQSKKCKNLFLIQLIGAVLFTVHFGLLGATTGFFQDALAVIRNLFLFSNKKWARSPAILILLLLSFSVAGFLTYNGFFSILPPIAMLVSTIVAWTKKGKVIRIGQIFGVSPFWLTYNISVFSISGIITECFVLISVVVSFIRFGFNGFENEPAAEKA